MINVLLAFIILLSVSVLAPLLMKYLRVPWRLAFIPVAAGYALAGLISGATAHLSPAIDILLWIVSGLAIYAVWYAAGHMLRPWLDEFGWRW